MFMLGRVRLCVDAWLCVCFCLDAWLREERQVAVSSFVFVCVCLCLLVSWCLLVFVGVSGVLVCCCLLVCWCVWCWSGSTGEGAMVVLSSASNLIICRP